jgi:hypothetical protein
VIPPSWQSIGVFRLVRGGIDTFGVDFVDVFAGNCFAKNRFAWMSEPLPSAGFVAMTADGRQRFAAPTQFPTPDATADQPRDAAPHDLARNFAEREVV